MRRARKRSQNPAYSTRGTAAYSAYAGMAAPPPLTGAATDVLTIVAPDGAAATENAWPQFEQNAAPAAITPPHLEQYTVPPLLFRGRSANPQKLLPNPTFKHGQGQSFNGQHERGKIFIALVRIHRFLTIHTIQRILLI